MKRITKAAVLVLVGGLAIGAVGSGTAQANLDDLIIKEVSFQNADVRSVINFLADYGKINMVASPDVQGDVTLNLRDISWNQTLNILTETYKLKAVRGRDHILILTLEDWMKTQGERERREADRRMLVTLETEIIDVKYASARDLVKPAKALLTERGKLDFVQRTNSIIARDEPDNVVLIAELIRSLDRETRQIRISAKLLEVSSNFVDELGINWSIVGSGKSGDGDLYLNDGSTDGADRVKNAFTKYKFSTIQRGWSLDATIDAIVSSGHGKVVAHPEITTVDNKEARIQMGQKVPIKQFDASGNVIIDFEEVGTILRVLPHITSDDRILLTLNPERSSYQFDPNGVIINTNNATTNVVVENGQTAVIGGLTTQDETSTDTGIPLLKDVPVLGALFRYKSRGSQSRDLIIFVTPTIVDAKLMGQVDTGTP